MDTSSAINTSSFLQKIRALFGMKEKAPLPWPIVDKSWKLTFVYVSRQQVAERIAKSFEAEKLISEQRADTAYQENCRVIAALVPKGNAWNDERAFSGSISHLAWKYPHFERIFAGGVFNEAFLERAQTLGRDPQNWSSGRLTDAAWLKFEKIARQYGVKLDPREAYASQIGLCVE